MNICWDADLANAIGLEAHAREWSDLPPAVLKVNADEYRHAKGNLTTSQMEILCEAAREIHKGRNWPFAWNAAPINGVVLAS